MPYHLATPHCDNIRNHIILARSDVKGLIYIYCIYWCGGWGNLVTFLDIPADRDELGGIDQKIKKFPA
jgi:hypothetical protein